MDNGIIRVGGRLAHGYSMTDDQRFPLLVSHRSKLATLAINDAHKRTLHGGPTATVAEMRRQIWVTQAMKKASACIKKCAKRKLEERYNNKRSIVKAHLAAIHALPAVKKESSVELRKLLESTNEHVQPLETLMLPVVISPTSIRVHWTIPSVSIKITINFVAFGIV